MLKTKFKFNKGHRDTKTDVFPWRLKTVFVNCVSGCNFNCFYCHSRPDMIPNQISMEVLKKVVNECKDMNVKNLILTGGEPLLHKDFKKILNLATKADLTIKIATNGYYLNNEFVEQLNGYNVESFQISLDTTDVSNFSKIKNVNEEAFKAVLENIKNIVNLNKFHVVVSSVITKANSNDLMELMEFCHNIGVDTLTVYKPIPINEASNFIDMYPSETEFIAILDQLIEKFRKLDNCWLVDMGYPWIYDSNIVKRWEDYININLTGCLAGKNSLTISVDGSVTPCVCLENKEFTFGNVNKESLEKLWGSERLRVFRESQIYENCNGCEISNKCYGGCRALAYYKYGKKDAPDYTCEYWR